MADRATDGMGRMIAENVASLQKAVAQDFKTASQEYVFETLAELGEVEFQKSQLKAWMEPVDAPVPQFLAKTGHRARMYREPYGVALVIAPFNGPLTLSIRTAPTALAARNTCILKLSETLSATSALVMEPVPKYFDPRAVVAVTGHREEVGELLKLWTVADPTPPPPVPILAILRAELNHAVQPYSPPDFETFGRRSYGRWRGDRPDRRSSAR